MKTRSFKYCPKLLQRREIADKEISTVFNICLGEKCAAYAHGMCKEYDSEAQYTKEVEE